MKEIELSKELKQEQLKKIRAFFLSERDEDISDFQADVLLAFILQEIGPAIYNQAVVDAHALMSRKVEELFELEKRAR